MAHYLRSPDNLWKSLEDAARFDGSVGLEKEHFPKMLERHISPIPYSEENLFGKMLLGEPYILTGFPYPLKGDLADIPPGDAGQAVMRWLGKNGNQDRHRLYVGPTGVRRDLTLDQIEVKWQADRTRFGVTDLHIKQTNVEEILDTETLSAFNILAHGGDDAFAQEMFSLVISSRGKVTDSHSDAPDSTNYSLTGQKLWLAWDTYEGLQHGLQDVERMPISGRARFDVETWLSLKSASWFLVNEGETLFLPAHLTHKVITLERYIGIGGFFIALPNCLRVMEHWVSHVPLWSKRDVHGERDGLLDDISLSVRDRIADLKHAPAKERKRWGYDYLKRSADHFIRKHSSAELERLVADRRFRRIAEVIEASWPDRCLEDEPRRYRAYEPAVTA